MAGKHGENFRQLTDIASTTGPDGSHIRELAGRSSALASHSLAIISHPAGTASTEHHHRVADEVYYVSSGRGRIRVDGIARPLAAGDIIQIHPGQRHKLWSDGPEDLVLIVTCSPAYRSDEVVWDE